MRGFMAAAAGTDSPSVVSWLGTFGIILPISAVVGGLLGWAEHLRRTGETRRRRLPRLAPLLFTVDPASLAVTLPALAGGYVLAGRGSRRARWVLGACAVLPVPAYFAAVAVADGSLRELGGPRALGHRAAVLPPRRADHRLHHSAPADHRPSRRPGRRTPNPRPAAVRMTAGQPKPGRGREEWPHASISPRNG